MAENAVIGALRVELGLDSASFEQGLKKTTAGLQKWQKVALLSFAAVATAGAAAAVGLGRAMDSAIDRFDAMGKAAQKVGVTVEALSRLNYAAQLSDVSLDQLTGGLIKLSANMAKVAAGQGPAAAFAALGISVRDATGELRSADAVFGDVAEQFARMEDGSTKTALAVQIFGKAGAELIPLLDEGRQGLAKLADESDAFGQTVSANAARNADEFGDNLEKVGFATQGVVNVVADAALPVLKYLSEAFLDNVRKGQGLETFAHGLVDAIKFTVSAVAVGVTALKAFGEAIQTVLVAGSIAQSGFQNWGFALDVLKNGFGDINEQIGATTEFVNGLWAVVDQNSPDGEGTSPLTPLIEDLGAAKEAARQFKQELQEGQEVFLATRTPFEALQLELDKLGHLLNKGVIDWETYERAVSAATVDTASQALGSIGNLVGGLSDAFGDVKALSIATAVLKGAESIASAFAEGTKYFGPVGGALFAGVAAATAALNVTRVASIGPSSKSIPGGGASSAPSVPTPAGDQQRGPQSIHLTLSGSGRYSREEVAGLMKQMVDMQGDGYQLVLSGP